MNSVLNPEAPEFHPVFTSFTKGGYSKINKTIRSSNSLPAGNSYDLFKTFTDFNIVTSQLSENVLYQSNQILTAELPAVKLIRNDNEYNTEKIIDANDSMLDRININIDTSSGVNEPNDKFMNGVKPNVASWNQTPIIAKIQVGSTTFIGAKNVARPQLNFKDAIDNSDSLWVPKISDKPNNVKPLSLNILYNDEGEAVGYEHPYKVELDLYHPPSQLIDPDVDALQFPLTLEETKLTYIDTETQLDALVDHLNKVKELAVDLEHHAYRTYQGITCLIQITTKEGGDFIIDALAIREHLHKLNQAFTDPKKLKVFHGAENDVLWLQRDFGVYLVGLFDTHQAARTLNLTGLSLKHLLLRYCNVNTDKRHQLADWRIRPLPEELLDYARLDTHYLLYIWRKMKSELLQEAAGQPHLLLSVFENSRHICGTTYNKEVTTDASHMPMYLRSKKMFNSQQLAALKMMYKWRDAQARELDESTTYLLPNHMLLALAETLPREVQGVNACCSPMPPFVKQNLITIHRMILSCRELPNETQLYQLPTSIRSMVNTTMQPLVSYNVHDYSHFHEYSEDYTINLDKAEALLDDYNQVQPDIEVFTPASPNLRTYGNVVSDLNVDAKLFIPPFDRYRKYRSLAQMEEIREFKEKEAKIAAIGKGNELIKTEVLVKLQQVKSHIETEEPSANRDEDDTSKKTKQRKRKMSSGKVETKEATENIVVNTKHEVKKCNFKKNLSNVNPYDYGNVDYKQFYHESNKEHKQSTKFKKYKK